MRQVAHSDSHMPDLNARPDRDASDTLGRRDGQLGRNKPNLGDGLHREMRFGEFAFGQEARERETAFQDKVQRALREATLVENFSEELDRARLLATAGLEPAPRSQVHHVAAPVEDTAAVRADQGVRLDALAQRIEAAAQAEMRTGRPGELAMRLDLGAADIGLASVTISLSPERLDVVLAASGPASAEMLLAAQALADRLGTRFARRVVRVFEAAPVEAEAPRDGMSEIASLFRQAGART